MAEPARERDVAFNRRARYEYHIEETVVMVGVRAAGLPEG